MKLNQIEVFRKNIIDELLRLHVEDIGVVFKCIHKLVVSTDRDDIESVLMDKLSILLENRTNEVVEVVCNNLNVRRHYNADGGRDCMIINDQECSTALSKVLQHRQPKNLKWSDIAGGEKKLDIPCGELLSKGVCMNADSCRFRHKDCAVVRPAVSKFGSLYDTSGDRADGRSYLLPEQNSYYDKMTLLPGARGQADGGGEDVISVSSGEGAPLEGRPTVFEPPSIMDSPIWYEEVGVIVADHDRHRDNDSDNDEDDDDSGEDRDGRRRTLVVYNVPRETNKIGALNKYFRRFGAVRHIAVNLGKGGTRAHVLFRLARDMRAADRCQDAVMGNRFIKTRPRRRRKGGKRKDRRKGRSRSSSIVSRSRSVSPRSVLKEDRDDSYQDNGEEEEAVAVVVKTEVVDVPGDEEVATEVSCKLEPMETEPVVMDTVLTNGGGRIVIQEPQDPKLERALHDSDLDSSASEDGASSAARSKVVGGRRASLRQDRTQKNGPQARLARTAESLRYYKSTLETLIVEYRRNDKAGKARLIPLIKEAHHRYGELRRQHQEAAASGRAGQEVGRLGLEVRERLAVAGTTAVAVEVPGNVVLDRGALQTLLGPRLPLQGLSGAPPSIGGLRRYILRLASPSDAAAALRILRANNPMAWSICLAADVP